MSSPGRRRPRHASALLRWQFRLAHAFLDAAIARLATEAVHRHPPGTAAPPGPAMPRSWCART